MSVLFAALSKRYESTYADNMKPSAEASSWRSSSPVRTKTSVSALYLYHLGDLCDLSGQAEDPNKTSNFSTHIPPLVTSSRSLFAHLLQRYYLPYWDSPHQTDGSLSTTINRLTDTRHNAVLEWFRSDVIRRCLERRDTFALLFGYKLIGLVTLAQDPFMGVMPSPSVIELSELVDVTLLGCAHRDHQVRLMLLLYSLCTGVMISIIMLNVRFEGHHWLISETFEKPSGPWLDPYNSPLSA